MIPYHDLDTGRVPLGNGLHTGAGPRTTTLRSTVLDHSLQEKDADNSQKIE